MTSRAELYIIRYWGCIDSTGNAHWKTASRLWLLVAKQNQNITARNSVNTFIAKAKAGLDGMFRQPALAYA